MRLMRLFIVRLHLVHTSLVKKLCTGNFTSLVLWHFTYPNTKVKSNGRIQKNL